MEQICILHTADLHLGSAMETHLPDKTAGMLPERQRELTAVFSDLVHCAEREGAQAVLLCGDISDHGILPPSLQAFVLDTIAAASGIRFFLVPGNHDLANGAAGCFSADAVYPDNLTVFGSEWETFSLDGVTVTGRILPREPEPFSMPELPQDTYNIVMLHGCLDDGTVFGGDGCHIPRRALGERGIDYLALGHLHAFCHEAIDARGIACQSGTPAGRGFDECGEKGWVLLTAADGKRLGARFIPSGARALYRTEVSLADVPSGIVPTEKAVFSALAELPSDSLVRVTLTGEDDIEAERGLSYLRERLSERFYYAELTDARTTRMDAARFRDDLSLKGAFVRRVLEEKTLSDTEREEILRCGLSALLGREL